MIVKVQVPLNADYPWALVYNEDRSFECQLPITEELLLIMHGEPKAFFEAHTEPDPESENGVRLHIDDHAPWQEW